MVARRASETSVIVAAEILDRAGDSLGEALPRLGGAVVLLVVGILVALLAGRLVRRVLVSAGLDALAERAGVQDVLDRLGLERSLSHLVGVAVRIALVVVAVVAAVSLLGLGALSTALNEVILFLPKLFVALALVLIGVVLAQFVGARAERLAGQLDLPGPLRQLAEIGIVALFVLTALAQLGIPTTILLALLAVVVLAAVLTLALAFGLGGRDVARHVSAGRYVASSFELGQAITMGDLRGEIIAFETSATLLRADNGATVRVPNQLLLDSVVTVENASRAPRAE
jgi:small-conductance mechanosensitive channel